MVSRLRRMTAVSGLVIGLLLLVAAGSAQAADEASAATGASQEGQGTQVAPVTGQSALQMPQGPGPAPGPGLAMPGAVSYAPMLPTSAAQATNPAVAQPGQPANVPGQTNLGGAVGSLGPYTLGPDDVVQIDVRGQPDFSGTFVIGQDGLIQYGIVGDIPANGLTKDQLAEQVAESLRRYVRFPSVNITITGFNSKAIYIVGQVTNPGKYAMRGDTIKIRDALVAAGLEKEYAAIKRVKVIRNVPGQAEPQVMKIDLKQVVYQAQLGENIDLVNGDTLVVPKTTWGHVTGFLDIVFGPIIRVISWALFF